MSESTMFDTHRYVQELTNAGLADPIAQVIADREARLLKHNLLTKEDLSQLELKFETVRSDLVTKIETVRSDLFKFIAVALSAQGSLIVGLLALIIKFL